MFCNNCGTQLPDGSKFCQNCGSTLPSFSPMPSSAPQSNSAPPVQPTPPQTPTPKGKKNTGIIIGIVAAVVVIGIIIAVALAGGKSENDNSDNDKETTPSSSTVADGNTEPTKIKVEPPEDFTIDTGITNAAPLEDLEIVQPNGSVWEMPSDEYGNSLEISAGYCSKTGVVKDFTMSVTLNKSTPEYYSTMLTLQTFDNQIKNLNDADIFTDVSQTDNETTFFCGIYGLNKADREIRVELAEELVGVSADYNTKAFYFDSVDAELKALGFE